MRLTAIVSTSSTSSASSLSSASSATSATATILLVAVAVGFRWSTGPRKLGVVVDPVLVGSDVVRLDRVEHDMVELTVVTMRAGATFCNEVDAGLSSCDVGA